MNNDYIQFRFLAKQNRLPPLIVAAFYGLPYCTYYLLTYCSSDVNETYCGATALCLAIANAHLKVVKLLLSHPGIKLNRQPDSIYVPLHKAIYCRDSSIFPLMLKQSRIDLNETDIDENNCFNGCVFVRKNISLRRLMEKSFQN